MNTERYGYSTGNNILNFRFESTGPKGVIKKAVRFDLQNANGTTYFNLVFGDWDAENGRIDDRAVSDNSDKEKVLATVASIVLDFTSVYPDMIVYATGSTPARTRLYQMGIAANLIEIIPLLDVYGERNGNWELFEKNINYDAFLVIRKMQ